ncbi:MAG TPA: hypothetical protein D7H93_05675 [Candidatus Poseidoniales archaeon]|nr:hypothetical protein [Euryarchaeota archaeon]DAC44744.1 MAG TPA: hypothetical protein D7H93_05675 [Candidatus Poseidoniales archaeon]
MLEQRSGKRDTSALTTAQFSATVTDHGVEVVLQFLNEIPCTSKFERCLKFFLSRFLIVLDIVPYRPVEEERFL